MNKKEVLEIKKQFTPANCAITRICGCYVDHEKNRQMETKEAFLSLPEEEAFKYFDIFKKTLSGGIGRNMLNMEFPLEQEMPGGTQEFLLKLKNSKLEDDELLGEFYDKIIENYIYEGNYYIIVIHAMYDIPGKASDNIEMYDSSDYVYEYLLCSICPVTLSKAGLSYNAEDKRMQDRIRDWIVEMPDKGFLFPAFNDRNTDLHGILYYTKKTQDLQPELIDQVLGANIPMSADTQKEAFQLLIEDTLGEDGNYEIVRNIHDTLNDMIAEHKEEPEPLELDKTDMKKVFENSGVPAENMELFEQNFDAAAGENTSLLAENIAETRKFNIETPDVMIKVNPDRADLVETRVIDGRQCLVIAVDDHIEVNGINVRTMRRPAGAEYGGIAESAGEEEYGERAESVGEAKYGERAESAGEAEYGEGAESAGEAERGEGAESAGEAEYDEGEENAGTVEHGEGAENVEYTGSTEAEA